MKNKIFLSITMLVSMSSQASHASMQEAPLLLMADHFKQVAMEFISKLAANPEVQEKLKQFGTQIKDDVDNLVEKSPNSLALRKDFDDLLGSLKEAALDTIKTHEKELKAISLELINNLLEHSKKDVDNLKTHFKALVVEGINELKPEIEAVMEELKKLYAAKDHPQAGHAQGGVKLPITKYYPTVSEKSKHHGKQDLHDSYYGSPKK